MRPPLFITVRQLMTAAVMLFACVWLTAQQAVTVNPVITPPYSPYLETYLDKAVINVTNNTSAQQRVKLTGSIESDNGLFVHTQENWQPPIAITLLPFQTKTIYVHQRSENFLDPGNVETNISQSQQSELARTGILPEGVYTFCVRAMDYDNGAPLSAPEPQGCMPFVISYPEPPILTAPLCESEVLSGTPVFTWMPPVGNLSGAMLRYDMYLVKLLPGQDPNEAMLMAVNYNAGNLFKITGLQTNSYVYKPSDPPLQNGGNYVWLVRAYDTNNKIVFQNDGRSEICLFTKKYIKEFPGAVVNNFGENPEENGGEEEDPPIYTGACAGDCLLPEETLDGFPMDSLPYRVAPDTIIKMGTFDIRVTGLGLPDPFHPNTISGDGLIEVPFINSQRLRVRVHFDSVKLNTEYRVTSGSARAKVQPGAASLIPQYDNTNWDGFSLGGANIMNIGAWIQGQIDSAKTEVFTAWNTYGFEMPMGIDQDGHSLAITKMEFHPQYATFCALAVVNLPNFTQNASALALGAGNVCFTKDDICQEGKLFLAQDFTVDLASGQQGGELTLLASTPDPLDTIGTFMTFDTAGVDIFHLQAEMALPQDKVVKVDENGIQLGIAKAYLTARMDSLSDWVLKASMDYFQITGSPDFTFMPGDIYIDLSDASNPPPPSDSITYFELASDPGWKGLFCQQMMMKMKTPLNQSNQPTLIAVNDLFIDTTGVSVNITGTNLISLGNGAIGTFNFSLSNLKLLILHNSFTYGRIDGAMLLNMQQRSQNYYGIFSAQGNNAVIPYHALITQMAPLEPDSLSAEKELHYEFLMHPVDSIEVPIWACTMMLDSTSKIDINNIGGQFFGSALLTGSFGIHSNIPFVGTTNFTGVSFQNFGLTTNAPYFSMGGVNFSLASPQHSIAGFPVSLNDINYVTDAQGHPGVQFDMGVNLSDISGLLPAATTKFSLFGRIDVNNGEVSPAFDHASLDEICLDGHLSVVHVKGCVSFFNSHQVYGDGFRGNLEVKFPPEVTVQATVQFGNVNNYNYWYADALAILPQGIPLFAGLEAFGFGGGAYYHMSRSSEVPNINMNSQVNSNGNNEAGYSMSGVQYVPDKSIKLGLKAKIYFGTVKRDVFNADVALEVTITEQGSLGKINLDGNGRFVSDDEMKKGSVTGTLKAEYDNVQKIFYTKVTAELDLVVITGSGKLEAYFDGGNGPVKWFVKFGRPMDNEWVNVTIAKFYTIQTYFEVGNLDIDPMPAPPAFIADLVKNGFEKSASERSGVGGDAFSIIHGGRSGFDYDGKFLIFYAKLEAGLGYDLSLQQVTTGCGGQGDPSQVGFNGWYATGQAYIGARGEVGIDADLGFVKGQFTIASIGAAAIIQGGFANPTWVKGAFAGYYELFDGVIKGNFNYEFAVGSECQPGDVDPLSKMKLISDISPTNNNNNVEVTTIPTIGTVLKMNPNATIYTKQKDAQGNTKHRIFRFRSELVTLELSKNNVAENLASWKKTISPDQYGIRWEPPVTLDKETNFSMKVTAQVEECSAVTYNEQTHYASCTGVWNIAKLNGQPFKEVTTSNFKTNKGLDKIPEDLVDYTIPYQQARTFMAEEWKNPVLKMHIGFNPNSYKMGPAGATIKYKARLVPLKGGANIESVPVTLAYGTKLLDFDWPGAVNPATFYAIQLVAEWKMPAAPQGQNGAFVSRQVTEVRSYQAVNYAIITTSQVTQNQLALPENSTLLYEIRFRTSKYKNIPEKLEAMKVIQAAYSVDPENSADFKTVTLYESDLLNNNTIVAAINKKVGNAPNTKPALRFMPYVWMKGPEMFDVYDMKGYQKTVKGTLVEHPPIVHYQNYDLSDFHAELADKLMKTLIAEDRANMSISMAVLKAQFNHWVSGPNSSKISWDEYKNGSYVEPGGNFMLPRYNFYQAQNGGIRLGSGPVRNGGINGGIFIPFSGTIKFNSEFDGKGWVPVAINPNVLIQDMVTNVNWNKQPSIETYNHFMERLGMAYDVVNHEWTTIGNIGIGSPVIVGTFGNVFNLPAVFVDPAKTRTGKK